MKKFISFIFLFFWIIIISWCNSDKQTNLDNANNQEQATWTSSQIQTSKQENLQIDNENDQLKDQAELNTNDSESEKVDYVNFFLTNHPEEINYDDLDKYFVSVKWNLENPISSTEDKILNSIKKLFEVKTYNYEQTDYVNYLYESDLTAKSVTNEAWKYIINIEWKIVGIGSVGDMFIKSQITKTIEQYTDNYTIKLNNSESEWRCSLDYSGECK